MRARFHGEKATVLTRVSCGLEYVLARVATIDRGSMSLGVGITGRRAEVSQK